MTEINTPFRASQYVALISSLGLDDIADVGGKGANLGELARAGFLVPPAFSVRVAAYDAFLKSNTLDEPISEIAAGIDYSQIHDVEQKTARIREMLSSAPIPGDIASAISHAYSELDREGGPPLVAVRSSVGTRDASTSSFPGQMDTYHNVRGAGEVLRLVQKCWASVWTSRAAATMHARGIDHRQVIIAPLVQIMVPADTAGVMFTSHPLTNNENELMIEAGFGLGEAVVSGTMSPDNYVICKENRDLVSVQPGHKSFRVECDPSQGFGNRRIDLSEEEAVKECLNPRQIRELAGLGIAIEEHYQRPQDVEWAYADDKLYLLQSRNITGLGSTQPASPPPSQETPPRRPDNVWSRKFGDEYMADYSLPLSYSLLVRWIGDYNFKEMAALQGREDLKGLEPIRNYQGYAYMSGLYAARLLRALPKRARDTDIIDWFPLSWKERIQEEPFQPLRLLGVIKAIRKDPRAPIGKNEKALQRHCRSIEQQIAPKIIQDYTALTESEWNRQFDQACTLGHEHFRVIRWGMGFHNPFLHGLLSAALTRWARDEEGELYLTIISGLPGTRTAEINRDIWRMGQAARSEKRMVTLLLGESLSFRRLRQESPNSPFWKLFDNFMERHGHRAATREIAWPRWRETPEVILGFVRAQLHAKDPLPDPETVVAESIRKRLDAEQRALEEAGRGMAGKLRQRALLYLFHWTQAYTCYRENQRYHLDYILTHLRALILERGRRLTSAGVLNEPNQVFYLQDHEFRRLAEDPAPSLELRSLLEERHQHYLLWKDRLPATYLFDDLERENDLHRPDQVPGASEAADYRTQGLGASHGRVQGPVRVVTELHHLDQVQPREILVTSNIDPGWTNVFPLLSGLITETGGLLSHGALLAREYGIPAVMGVNHATSEFQTGETVEVNGSLGTIQRFAKPLPGPFQNIIQKEVID